MTHSAEKGLHPCAGCGLELDADDACDRCEDCAEKDAGTRGHDWVFDGYFWHHCRNCGRVS